MHKLTDSVICLGNYYFNYFLVGQKEALIIECGVTGGVASLKAQWPKLQRNTREVKNIIAMHAHFDHVCGIPELRKIFPEAKINASSEAKRILKRSKIIDNFCYQDDQMSEKLVEQGILNKKPETPNVDILEIDTVISPGDIIEIDKHTKLEILDAPGHSPCSLAGYLPSEEIMFVSDAAGFQISDKEIFPVFFQNYEMYIETIKKLMAYPTQVLGVPHGKIILQNEVKPFYERALQSAQEAFRNVEKMLDEGINEEEIKRSLFAKYYTGNLRIYTPDNISQCVEIIIRRVKECL